MGKLFGTDGIRGIAGDELTPDCAYRLGMAVSMVLTGMSEDKPKVIIGKDTRLSGDMFEAAITAGLCAMGSDVYLAGVVPTPAVAYMITSSGAQAGVMISASHNPSEYNGIKVFGSEGYKLSDELEEKIEDIILNGGNLSPVVGARIGRVYSAADMISDYVRHVSSVLASYKPAEPIGKKVLFDLSNGSASVTAKLIFSSRNIYGMQADFIAYDPNGININDNCGSTQMGSLSAKVVNEGYDIGIAFDGDADRCLVTDENGSIIDGDMIIARIAVELKREGKLTKNAAVVTKLSNLGFHRAMKENGIDVYVTDVGDRYVREKMLESGANIGGEQAGHIILSELATPGHGQLTASEILRLMAKYPSQTASELFSTMKALPQVSMNVKVPSQLKKLIANNPAVRAKTEEIAAALGENGRIILRPSGTEALIRVMLEGEDESQLVLYAKEVIKEIEDNI